MLARFHAVSNQVLRGVSSSVGRGHSVHRRSDVGDVPVSDKNEPKGKGAKVKHALLN